MLLFRNGRGVRYSARCRPNCPPLTFVPQQDLPPCQYIRPGRVAPFIPRRNTGVPDFGKNIFLDLFRNTENHQGALAQA
ncbi:unnamed protein product [Chondrus crispus]|uniref:Uncharacterized protein n=1 Tax=Chondrus crispus TaxID=2769 RepID=R7QAB0_CHOCR|nr:unnamed protein product [Chondrus crispus]CDF34405.1 unnamed protein product [Chondrus crispus]|eukprot:XP_005714224.1 unnamed protein product [Chondrus crispus]